MRGQPADALSELPGARPDSGDEDLLKAFEEHLDQFEDIANTKYVAGDLVDGEVRINNSD